MKHILQNLFDFKTLQRDDAKLIMQEIAQQKYNHMQIASFLTVFAMRSVTVDEMLGFTDALQEGCIPVNLDGYNAIDMCGTGGDGKDTFNISTIASFVVAGAGINVAKHGNYAVSSQCGSSNLMEVLGYTFSTDQAKLQTEIEKAGMCYMHAPFFHPPMKEVGPIRKQLAVRTFFNMAGPLVNPAKPVAQSVGVYNLQVARIYKYMFQTLDKKFIILHSTDGYDEVSLTAPVKVFSNNFEKVLQTQDFGLSAVKPHEIKSGTSIAESVKICLNVLDNCATQAQKDVVLANAATGIKLLKPELSFIDCVAIAKESLESGKAKHVMKTICK